MRRTITLLSMFAVTLACGTSTTSREELDEDAIRSVLSEQNSSTTDDVIVMDTTQMGGGAEGFASPIEPLFFWRTGTRQLVSVEVTFDYGTEPPTALAVMHWEFTGTFHIITADDVIDKPLHHLGTRHVWLEKTGADADRHRGWIVAAVSGLESHSDSTTRSITSIRLQGSGLDTTITSMTGQFVRDAFPAFAVDDTVTVTATTGDSTDVVLLHTQLHRQRMTNTGGAIFTATFVVRDWFEPFGMHEHRARQVAVDVIHHETLYDDSHPYDSRVWSVPWSVAE